MHRNTNNRITKYPTMITRRPQSTCKRPASACQILEASATSSRLPSLSSSSNGSCCAKMSLMGSEREEGRVDDAERQDSTMVRHSRSIRIKCKNPIKVNRSSRVKLALVYSHLSWLLAWSGRWMVVVEGQCPENTLTSFEKIGGVTIKDLQLTLLYSAPNISTLSALTNVHGGSATELQRQYASAMNFNVPITAECNNRCRRNKYCRAFLVDYARHTCWSVEQQTAGLVGGGGALSSAGLMRAPPPIHLVPTQQRTAYFEKVCLNLPNNDFCERAWIYERVIGYHIQGHDDRIVNDVASRLKCQQLCVTERDFRCRSGEYDSLTMQCRLSAVDRHLKPSSFRPAAHSIDYFENQCVPVGNQCDAFDRYEDMDLGRAEIMRPANTSDQCQEFCTQKIKAFICRSFTWNPITSKCYLNSANSAMVGGLDQLISAPGLTYYQRNDCIDLKLECDNIAMTLNLRTNEPFKGRMYVRDDPNNCEMMGRSALVSTLSIPFQSQGRARCAQREPPNRYSSVVVVQQHPKIQRKSDRYIKVVCDFQTANKTITSSYDVVANPWTSAALINATSFAPKIKLRITDKFGEDIAGAKLGDELQLRIEAETESVYDMVARSVWAKSGNTDESILLIDKEGCPTDFRIFPPLKKLNRRTIVGRFDAFKFSSDVVVRFQVDVQFCLNQCPPTTCDSNLLHHTNTAQLSGDTFESTSGDQSATGNQVATSTSSSTTTSTSTTSQPSVLSDNSLDDMHPHNSNQQPHHMGQPAFGYQKHHDGLNSAYALSSTQPPVPFQRATPAYQATGLGDPSTRPMQQMMGSNHSDSVPVYAGNHQANAQSSAANTYYYNPNTNNRHQQQQQQHPSAPANSPAASQQLNYTALSSQQHQQANSILDALSIGPTSDPQVFESSQGRSASGEHLGHKSLPPANLNDNNHESTKRQKQQQQQMAASNSIDGIQTDSEQQAAAGSARMRRRRRSAEPMPQGPRHVPLQREIIVSETSPTGKDGGVKPTLQTGDQQQHPARARRRDGKRRLDVADGGGLNRNGPAYDLNEHDKKVRHPPVTGGIRPNLSPDSSDTASPGSIYFSLTDNISDSTGGSSSC